MGISLGQKPSENPMLIALSKVLLLPVTGLFFCFYAMVCMKRWEVVLFLQNILQYFAPIFCHPRPLVMP